ncbi:hypothetical protein [Pyruvatibacter sp.]|uniref:hypothetical protein n=1 Tax=Pyruvatibacter sp. TaxID=1981328 RepID=UPI003265160C
MNTFLAIAAGLSLFNLALHFFMGGRSIARPLLNDQNLTTEVKYVLYYCWHLVTLAIALQAGLFAVAVLYPAMPEVNALVVTGTLFAASFAALGIFMAPALKISYSVLPQGWLFVPVAVCGVVGLT